MSLGGYTVGGTDYLIKCSDNQRTNTSWTIVYVKAGAGMYNVGTYLRCLNDGDIIIMPPHVDYSFRSEDLGDEYNININAVILRFDQVWLDNLLKVFPAIGRQVLKVKEIKNHMAVHGTKWMRMSSILSALKSCPVEEQPLRILEIIALISSDTDMTIVKEFEEQDVLSTVSRIEKIDRFLSCNYRNKVTLQDVADYLGMNRIYFSMFFKSHYKEGFSDYLNRLRIKDAAVMLRDTDIPIPLIASECGFKTVQYFTRTFKKMKGVPPGEYRRN